MDHLKELYRDYQKMHQAIDKGVIPAFDKQDLPHQEWFDKYVIPILNAR
jgi:hypothetical protein